MLFAPTFSFPGSYILLKHLRSSLLFCRLLRSLPGSKHLGSSQHLVFGICSHS
jgi:hypothetical protein